MKTRFENLLVNAMAGKEADDMALANSIVIRDDFKQLIPSLDNDELRQLEDNILAEGIRESLIVWRTQGQMILVDGHNRLFLSQKHGLKFSIREMQFRDEAEVMDWMIRNQLGRRNLTKEQASYFRGLRYNSEKSQGKRHDLTLDQNDLKLNESTAAILGKEYNVSEATIKRDGDFSRGLDKLELIEPGIKKRVLSGELKGFKNLIRKANKIDGIGPEDLKSPLPHGLVSKKNIVPKAKEVASIAIEFITKESRPFVEVVRHLGIDINSNPLDFFIKWKNTKQ